VVAFKTVWLNAKENRSVFYHVLAYEINSTWSRFDNYFQTLNLRTFCFISFVALYK